MAEKNSRELFRGHHKQAIVQCLDTVVISGEDVCCSVVFGVVVGVFVFSVIWSELLMIYAISLRVPESGVCGHISGEN